MPNRELKKPTIVLMIVTALLFDVLQWLFTFIFMGWLVGFYAFLTFYVWFRTYGITFTKPKRFLTMGGTFIIEIIPFLNVLPAWTAAVAYLALDAEIKKAVSSVVSSVPGGKIVGTIAPKIISSVNNGMPAPKIPSSSTKPNNVLDLRPRTRQSTDEEFDRAA